MWFISLTNASVRAVPMPVGMLVRCNLDADLHRRAWTSVYCVLYSSGRHMTRIFI